MLNILQAIETKYHGPTNTLGSRVSAKAEAGRIILEWDDSKNSDENHEIAARMLQQKFGWDNVIVGGGFSDRRVWVPVPSGFEGEQCENCPL